METNDVRVLVVVTTTDRRGAEIEGARLAESLDRSGVAATAVSLAPGAGSVVLPIGHLGAAPLGLGTLRALRRAARTADVVVAYGSSTLPACAIALAGTRTPFLYRSIGDPARWVRGGLHRRRTAVLMRRAAAIVALWPGAADALAELYRIDRSQLHVIPNARDILPGGHDGGRSVREELGIAPDRTLVLFAGALSPEKRPHLAVAASVELADASLVVLGDGPLRAEIDALERDSPRGRVRVLGSVTDVDRYLDAADCVLLTSSTEGMPGILVEAALAGVPSVATDVGAVRWLADRGAPIAAVPVDSTPATIADAIRTQAAGSRRPPALDDVCTWSAVTPLWVDVLRAVTTVSRDRRRRAAGR